MDGRVFLFYHNVLYSSAVYAYMFNFTVLMSASVLIPFIVTYILIRLYFGLGVCLLPNVHVGECEEK